MKTYTDHDGVPWQREQLSYVSQDMFADLVEAFDIARAYQAECERLERWKDGATAVIERWEAAYEVAGIDPAGNLGRYKSDLLADEIRRLHASEDELSAAVTIATQANIRLTNKLRNAEAACVDAGTWCDGIDGIVSAIERLGAK